MAGVSKMKVSVRGVVYKNAHEVSKKMKVSLSTVYAAVHLGKSDTIGLGRGSHRNHVSPRAIPIQIGPLYFKSHTQAAKFLGVSRKTLMRAKKDAKTNEYILGKAQQKMTETQNKERGNQ